MVDEHFGARVGEDRRADRKRFEGEERQAFVRRRHDDDRGGLERVETFLVRQHARERAHAGRRAAA